MAGLLASSALLAGPPATRLSTARQQQRRLAVRQRSGMAVRAAAQEPKSSAVQDLARTAERVFARYDFLSAGMGALAVTGFCVMRGQDVGTALWITAAATVVAILVNDLLPEEL